MIGAFGRIRRTGEPLTVAREKAIRGGPVTCFRRAPIGCHGDHALRLMVIDHRAEHRHIRMAGEPCPIADPHTPRPLLADAYTVLPAILAWLIGGKVGLAVVDHVVLLPAVDMVEALDLIHVIDDADALLELLERRYLCTRERQSRNGQREQRG